MLQFLVGVPLFTAELPCGEYSVTTLLCDLRQLTDPLWASASSPIQGCLDFPRGPAKMVGLRKMGSSFSGPHTCFSWLPLGSHHLPENPNPAHCSSHQLVAGPFLLSLGQWRREQGSVGFLPVFMFGTTSCQRGSNLHPYTEAPTLLSQRRLHWLGWARDAGAPGDLGWGDGSPGLQAAPWARRKKPSGPWGGPVPRRRQNSLSLLMLPLWVECLVTLCSACPPPRGLLPTVLWLLYLPQGPLNALLCWTTGDCCDDDEQLY